MSISLKTLLYSKWTALQPVDREKHFLVIRVLVPEDGATITEVELQAIHSRRVHVVPWRTLDNTSAWAVGWH